MKRKVFIIPFEEIKEHFRSNSRQDIKIIVPKIMDEFLFNFLSEKNLNPEKEEPLEGITWQHSPQGVANKICESGEFDDYSKIDSLNGTFSLSFATKEAHQDEHYHKEHIELYYSESHLKAKYRIIGNNMIENVDLPSGGVIVFGPGVIHKAELEGITLILEFPTVEKDKFLEKL